MRWICGGPAAGAKVRRQRAGAGDDASLASGSRRLPAGAGSECAPDLGPLLDRSTTGV
ncbi:MAG: hypothetical protein ACREPA_03530 [Candidatus Dormibacteraceae bacterium]